MSSDVLTLVIPGERGQSRAREGDPVTTSYRIVYWMPASAGMTREAVVKIAEIAR